MNANGHTQTLVPRQMGNSNALKHGISSPGKMLQRTTEFETELLASFEFPPSLLPTVHQAACCLAYLDEIDGYFDEHGLVDRKGKPHYLLNKRSHFSRELERWWAMLVPTIERQTVDYEAEPVTAETLTRELQRIVTGQDSGATTHDRLAAIRLLNDEAAKKRSGPAVTLVFRGERARYRAMEAAKMTGVG